MKKSQIQHEFSCIFYWSNLIYFFLQKILIFDFFINYQLIHQYNKKQQKIINSENEIFNKTQRFIKIIFFISYVQALFYDYFQNLLSLHEINWCQAEGDSFLSLLHLVYQYDQKDIIIQINIQIYSQINCKGMKSAVKQEQKPKQYVEPRQIHQLYRLSHSELQTTLKRLKQKILSEFDDFSSRLVGALNHLNYFRYMRAFPQDDIKFVFRQKGNASVSESRFEQKQQIMQKMVNFQIMRVDYSGVSDNCIFEIQQLITEKDKNILNLKQFCPSGYTFVKQNKQHIDSLLPYWEQQTGPMDLTGIFKEVSQHFPKQQIKNLGQIFSQADLKITSAKLIFRASQHNFQSASFKDHCVGKGPTLLLVKSDKGLMFGGFTPCKWLKTKEQQFVSDPNAKSFLFSLNKRMIFPIKQNQKNYAISAYGGWGPIFGSPYGPDLSISDKCHINEHSCSSLGSHYEIPPNIKQYSNEAYSLLAGSKNFKALEYQLYELQIE